MKVHKTRPNPEPTVCTSYRTLTQFVCRQSVPFTINFHLLETDESWWARNNYKIVCKKTRLTMSLSLEFRKWSNFWYRYCTQKSLNHNVFFERTKNVDDKNLKWFCHKFFPWVHSKLISAYQRFMNMQILFWTITIPIWIFFITQQIQKLDHLNFIDDFVFSNQHTT